MNSGLLGLVVTSGSGVTLRVRVPSRFQRIEKTLVSSETPTTVGNSGTPATTIAADRIVLMRTPSSDSTRWKTGASELAGRLARNRLPTRSVGVAYFANRI